MTPERWAQVRSGVEALLATPPEDRDAFLRTAFGGDSSLRADVEAQTAACESAAEVAGFMQGSAAAFAAPILDDTSSSVPESPLAPTSATITEMELGTALAGRYEIERELGRGGTSTVYLARDHRHGRRVALKVLEPAVGAGMSAERFLREIHVTAGLTHPHILPLHDSGIAGRLLYYVMPFIEGETLRDQLAGGKQLSLDAVRRLIREVASALAYAHRRDVVHRDIKPENILLEDGHAIVADFGIARAMRRAQDAHVDSDEKNPGHGHQSVDSSVAQPSVGAVGVLTESGIIPGTPAYMAPEQARGNTDVDQRVDIYALGVVAYEALTGTHPFGARTAQAMAAAHATEVPTPVAIHRPDVPDALAALVMRSLDKDPAARPQSATEVIALLDDGSDRPSPVAVGKLPGIVPSVKTRAIRAALASLTVALAIGISAWVLTHSPTARRNAARGPRLTAVAMGSSEPGAIRRGTSDLEAYELYLKGRFYWTERGKANIARSISYFKQAIARDSLFARAHAGLSMAYMILPMYAPDSTRGSEIGTDRAVALAQESAERAIALDSTLVDAQLAMGSSLETQLKFQEALSRYRIASRLDPSTVSVYHFIGMNLLTQGRTEEAIAQLRHAHDVDPMAPSPSAALSGALTFARRFGDADAAAHRALDLDSTFALAIYSLGLSQTLNGQPDSAIMTLKRGLAMHPDDSRLTVVLVLAYAVAGQWDAARRLRDQLKRPGAARMGWAESETADLIFGDREPLVRLLTKRSAQVRYVAAGGIFGCNPVLDPLWGDARFVDAMRKLGVSRCKLARPWPLASRPDV